MATIIVSFNSEQEAQDAIERLSQANVSHVQARLLSYSETSGYPAGGANTPMVTPDGTLDVRPSDPPDMLETRDPEVREEASGSIPTTGTGGEGFQVLIETDEENEAAVRQILSQGSG